jgi:transposase-like protein
VERETLEALLARGLSLEAIGRRFGKHPSTVGYWVRKHGLRAAHRTRHAPRGGLPKNEVERLIAQGASVSFIAQKLDRSETTVSYWLRKWGLRTQRGVRRRDGRRAKSEGKGVTQLVCRQHGPTDFRIEGRGSYRCTKCRGEAVARRRRRVKEILVEEAGGHCRRCGYAGSIAALQFHHVDPARKSFGLGYRGVTRSIALMRAEARKCILLCANCHAEVEAGIVAVDAQGQ